MEFLDIQTNIGHPVSNIALIISALIISAMCI